RCRAVRRACEDPGKGLGLTLRTRSCPIGATEGPRGARDHDRPKSLAAARSKSEGGAPVSQRREPVAAPRLRSRPRAQHRDGPSMATQTMGDKQSSTLDIQYQDKHLSLPLVHGTEDEVGVDIQKLRSGTGLITLDPGYGNTGACRSSITY